MRVGGQSHTLVALPPQTYLAFLIQEVVYSLRTVWTGTKNLALTGIRPRAVQPAASCCTDCSMPSNMYDSNKCM